MGGVGGLGGGFFFLGFFFEALRKNDEGGYFFFVEGEKKNLLVGGKELFFFWKKNFPKKKTNSLTPYLHSFSLPHPPSIFFVFGFFCFPILFFVVCLFLHFKIHFFCRFNNTNYFFASTITNPETGFTFLFFSIFFFDFFDFFPIKITYKMEGGELGWDTNSGTRKNGFFFLSLFLSLSLLPLYSPGISTAGARLLLGLPFCAASLSKALAVSLNLDMEMRRASFCLSSLTSCSMRARSCPSSRLRLSALARMRASLSWSIAMRRWLCCACASAAWRSSCSFARPASSSRCA